LIDKRDLTVPVTVQARAAVAAESAEAEVLSARSANRKARNYSESTNNSVVSSGYRIK
jgi:hypothetical protein